MVKNTTGGTKTKGLARKHQNSGGNSKLRLPEDELEQIAFVNKMLGNGMCEIITNNNEKLIGHIRNKFRGRHKRHNLISSGSIVLIGLREWEKPIKNCDILTIYEDSHIKQLSNMPNIKMDNITKQQNIRDNIKEEDNGIFEFTNKITSNENEDDSDEEEFTNKMNYKNNDSFVMEKVGNIDIDDI
jgi:initiation factor 1A